MIARDFPLEPRAHILLEERLEALAFSGDVAAVKELIREEQPGIVRD